MNALRRTSLVRITLLALAVVFSYTARAATPVSELHRCVEHCATKVAAELPTPEKKFPPKKFVRPTRFAPHSSLSFHHDVVFPSAHAELGITSTAARQVLLADRTLAVEPQNRRFALRL